MPELINAQCKQGLLIITDQQIHTTGALMQSMLRSELTDVKLTVTAKPFFGIGGKASLIFHSQGEMLRAEHLKIKEAQQIKQALGY